MVLNLTNMRSVTVPRASRCAWDTRVAESTFAEKKYVNKIKRTVLRRNYLIPKWRPHTKEARLTSST